MVTDDSAHAQTFYLDGKKHDDKDDNGKKISSTKTDWQGDTLVAETKLDHGTKLTQSFRVSDDGKELTVVSRLENSSLQGPVTIRRVYDLMGRGPDRYTARAAKIDRRGGSRTAPTPECLAARKGTAPC